MSLDNTPEQSQLGRESTYADHYDASLLFPIPRSTQREAIGIAGHALPFFGADLWTAFELSWLNPRGKPQLVIAHFTIPCETPNIVESKSFKLYLNSFNGTVFTDVEAVRERLKADLSEAVWRGSDRSASIGVRLVAPGEFDRQPVHELEGLDLDRLDIECTQYQPTPELLSSDATQAPVTETLTSRLLKSNCLVTGQPDWGSVQIRYSGPAIDQAGLLAYIVSFRNHNEFHEPCAERMFTDIWRRCQPTKLAVYARYTRRGGLDINPFRTSWPQPLPANTRTARQ
ncbi:NADPH-dependent 7-cyano-7-deazaguanine reductase QueF [Variovorax sp. J22P240]|uniref:NADPH-dependent 7-cyano-7-deazaguanine reductase QueF n=1 Tax=unclassified Variovorax TaxID=663243 RepID=UPI0025770C01|nr:MULTISPECIES: NADPH-dependent 7-cyano-7-deazaguanine reductase QueF [unclassified Variovorax]MDM0000783.1 NADPH-dependent 7-cyano-7-deazaguanine reductase QueF [Variovorax sp. J22P240]MDM0053661.1 NADPH-dependent 7-cyano-7-deazaguanine reductase QueF [Variovorax sp. J22R115]